MSASLGGLSHRDMRVLAEALDAGRVLPPFSNFSLDQIGVNVKGDAVLEELNRLCMEGMKPAHVAFLLRALASEREEAQRLREGIELVWTGPDVPGAPSRDTYVVVRELFASAETSVLVSGYALYQGQTIFKPLSDRMQARPSLDVRLFLNVGRPTGDPRGSDELVREFAEAFRARHWPGAVPPSVFYDPRSLDGIDGQPACLHAKCIVIDDSIALITSANLTQAAQERNIEAGVLVSQAHFARSLRAQFDSLVDQKALRPIPGLRQA